MGGVERWLPVIAMSVAAFPLTWLAMAALVRRRPSDARRVYAEIGMLAGTLPWLWMTLTPLPGPPRRLRLVPLFDIASLLTGPLDFAFVQIGGNLLVFAAFGFFAPRRWPIGPWAVAGLAALASTAVETAQYVLAIGRVSSVDDVLLNALGALLFAILSRRLLNDRSGAG
jgi:glycopeptide antibiotics resistance protein